MSEKEKNPIVDKEVFDTFFKENYCELEYSNIKSDFEAVAARGLEELFTDDTDITKLTEKNFVLYLRSDVYAEFEEIVEDAFDSLNSEILDAVMDVSTTVDKEVEISSSYWDTNEELLNRFLRILFEQKIAKMIEEC